ncbi:hypothetical protein B0T10DRAFT_571423 [Thelonectria olida]|uniref:Uncharacterized protein n=1 Tax=Thelonectria olida TaxID=1576542 RepID=A0A9P9AWR9_9HYPO|nr:hypothetical protein B0T10DRAFT_571423 [Thelonectria olida]
MIYSKIASTIINILDIDQSKITSTFLGHSPCMGEECWAHTYCPVDELTGKSKGHELVWVENGHDAFLRSIVHWRVVERTGTRKIKVTRSNDDHKRVTKTMNGIRRGQGLAKSLGIYVIPALQGSNDETNNSSNWYMAMEMLNGKAIESVSEEDLRLEFPRGMKEELTLTMASFIKNDSQSESSSQTSESSEDPKKIDPAALQVVRNILDFLDNPEDEV